MLPIKVTSTVLGIPSITNLVSAYETFKGTSLNTSADDVLKVINFWSTTIKIKIEIHLNKVAPDKIFATTKVLSWKQHAIRSLGFSSWVLSQLSIKTTLLPFA